MDVVILAAGRGERLRPLTDRTPKALLPIHGKPILQWTLEALPAEVEHVIVVVQTHAEQIRASVRDTRVSFAVQPELLGTFSALRAAKSAVHSDAFLVLFGDNLYDAGDLARLSQVSPWAMGVIERPDPGSHVAIADQNVVAIERAAPAGRPRNVCVGAFCLDARIFDIFPIAIRGTVHTEMGLPQTMTSANIPIHAVAMTRWQPVGTPEEYTQAQNWR